MRLALVVVVSLVGCIRPNLIDCGDLACSADSICVGPSDALHCATPDQLAACVGAMPNAVCVVDGANGLCVDGACEPSVCGDGRRTGTEACDGSDLGGADCTTAGFYEPDGLTCTQFCTFDTDQCVGRCGDGIVNGPELCDGAPPDGACVDNGFDAGPLNCSNSCGASFSQCARFGWAPEPIALPVAYAISAVTPTDLWVVGGAGQTLHFDGATWTAFPTNLSSPLTGVWATATNDVWTVGSAGVAHWDGTQWTVRDDVPAANYVDVWAANATSVFVATTDAGVIAWNGTSWAPLGMYSGGAIDAIRGTSASDLWAASTTGTLWHWNGATWQASLTATIDSVSAVAIDDVWVSGSIGASYDSLIAHWDGQMWTQWSSPLAGLYSAITASAPDDVWVALTGGTLEHFDGTAWTVIDATVGAPGANVSAFANFGPGLVIGLSNGEVLRYRGQTYVTFAPDVSRGMAFWMDAGNDVFIADSLGHILHYDGTSWTGSTTVVDTVNVLFGTGPDNVWSSGADQGHVYRFESATNTWSFVTTIGTEATGIWGSGPTDLWVSTGVGAQHYDGAVWQAYVFGAVSAISGSGPDDVWAIGGTDVWHWDGVSWTANTSSPASFFLDIVDIAPDLVVAIDSSYAYTWNGTSWTTQLLPIVNGAQWIAASASDYIVAASGNELAQFDGTRWSPVRLPPGQGANPMTIAGLVTTPNMIAMMFNVITQPVSIQALLRTQPWVCEAKETNCTNGVDDDCDGKIDGEDSDCQ